MNRYPLRSIRARLSASLTIVISCLLVVADIGLIAYANREAIRRADHSLSEADATVQAALRNEAEEAQETPDKGGPPPAAEALRESQTSLNGDRVAVLIRDGAGHSWESEGAAALQARVVSDQDWRIRRLDHFRVGDITYSIVLGAPMAKKAAALRTQALLLTLLTLFAVPVMAVGAWLLVGSTLRPIDLLVQEAREQGRRQPTSPEALGAVRPHLHPPSPDAEVVRLVATLNDLLDFAVDVAEARGRFYTAASHELRTPLQVLSGRVELALSRDRSAEEYRASLEEVQEQADRLVSLVQSLLLLNRIEYGGDASAVGERERVNLVPLCRREAEALRLRIAERDLDWRVEIEESLDRAIVAAVSASHVEILLRNLMENAARYTPRGGKVRLILHESEDRSAIRFDLSNEASPLAEGDLARLFEPFYRPDPSRNAETGGNGLGLSICRAIAGLNRWELSLRQQDGWLSVAVVFPKELL